MNTYKEFDKAEAEFKTARAKLKKAKEKVNTARWKAKEVERKCSFCSFTHPEDIKEVLKKYQ